MEKRLLNHYSNGRQIPITFIDDIESITHDEWKEARKNGIGGSDAGTIMYGKGKFKSPFDLALSKVHGSTEEEKSIEDIYRLNTGHAQEANNIWYYGKKYNADVFTDRGMYQSPKYPFMLANCDGFAVTEDGEVIGLEIKTTSPWLIKEWQSGVHGKGGYCPNQEYVCQVMHYMCVMDLDRFDIVCSCSNNANDIAVVTVNRDDDFIERLIEKEKDFWEHRFDIKMPQTVSSPQKAISNAKKLAEIGVVIKESEIIDAMNTRKKLLDVKKKYKTKLDEVEGQINAQEMLVMAYCEKYDITNAVTDAYSFSYVEKAGRESYDLSELRKHPELDIYKKISEPKKVLVIKERKEG